MRCVQIDSVPSCGWKKGRAGATIMEEYTAREGRESMCTRFVYRGDETITGFNFDIDPAVWNHRIIQERDRFHIGILRPDGTRHSYHGVNRNGNVGTLLYVHGNPAGAYRDSKDCVTIAELTEQFVQAKLSFDDALKTARERKIVYAPDATMQAMLSDRQGRTLIIEPGVGWREDDGLYSLITNYSVLAPESTRPFLLPGDDRYERAAQLLKACGRHFTVADAFSVLRAVRQEGIWATRVSFVYTSKERAVYFVRDNDFAQIEKYEFPEL